MLTLKVFDKNKTNYREFTSETEGATWKDSRVEGSIVLREDMESSVLQNDKSSYATLLTASKEDLDRIRNNFMGMPMPKKKSRVKSATWRGADAVFLLLNLP